MVTSRLHLFYQVARVTTTSDDGIWRVDAAAIHIPSVAERVAGSASRKRIVIRVNRRVASDEQRGLIVWRYSWQPVCSDAASCR